MDHMLDVVNVKTTSGDIRGDQQRCGVGHEAVEVLQPLLLVHLCVQPQWSTPEMEINQI